MKDRRMEALDSLRGVAALLVVVYHLSQVKLGPKWLTHGYLAVDFFFILSGVVLAHAYESRLRAGMSLRDFAGRRAVRLLPLSVAGTLLGVAVLFLKYLTAPRVVGSLSGILASSALNAFLLPSFFGGAELRGELFPGNGPLWSLFFEVAANLVWAGVLFGKSNRALGLVAGLCGAAFAAAIAVHGSGNVGWDERTFLIGFARVGYGFTLGVLIYRMRARLELPPKPWLAAALAPLLAVVLAFPRALGWELAAAFLMLPSIVCIALSQPAGRFGRWLGELSYPVYVLHFPVLALCSGIRQKFLPSVHPWAVGVVALCVTFALSWLAFTLYDAPLRKLLSARRRAVRAPAPALIEANAPVR